MQVGDIVEDFKLPDDTGQMRSLGELLAAGPVVLFFYPAAMTRGCTAESCHFRDLNAEFGEVKAQRLGISADRVDKQHQFADKYSLDFPLLSDVDRAVAKVYGVKQSPSILPNRRATFVIDRDGTVLEVIRSETRMDHHADRALEVLRSRSA